MTPPRLVSERIKAPHGFFGRGGGVSGPPFESLNASLASGDDPDTVMENRHRVTETLGASHLLTAKQTHSAEAVLIAEPFGFADRPSADALVTRTPGLAVGALAADCIPILMQVDDLVAAVHAGWRGSLGGVIEGAVALMEREGARRDRIRAAIGPCLRQESFEVRADLIDEVTSRYPEAAKHFTRISPDQSLYDHAAFARERLLAAGLLPEHIDDVGGDTLSETDRFFSYRGALRAGEKQFGHNVSAIVSPGVRHS